MAKGIEKKARMLMILRFLEEETDENHGLTEKQLEDRLAEKGIVSERRHIYDDLHALELCGYEIGRRGRPVEYYLASRLFTLPELKLLVDAVQSSRFLTVEKSGELIRKLEKLCSPSQARELSRSVHVQNRIKAMNESIYSNVDSITAGINRKRQISFLYFNWNAEKQKISRHGGKVYTVSPFALTWADDNYYMIAWDAGNRQIRHYRVDRMQDITLTDLQQEGSEEFGRADLALYTNRHFGMFSGEPCAVRLEFEDRLAGILIDRFGTEPTFFKVSDHTHEVTVNVVPSPQFYGWVVGLGDEIAIRSPEWVIEGFRRHIDALRGKYDN